ncbi:MAG: hypothetical protein CVU05_05015 [Bacteroidetes bacterium HGW-Bacteroidetes-21]|nr:MAG: hypothetical protein CVU05_05015 [Bacteroidetes bacterium HGW-Bacteroidetes-21]
MHKSRIILFIISLTFLTVQVKAQAPKYSNEFLSIGIGARALGMGNASVASVNDVTAGYWNPSLLTNIPSDLQLGAMHAEYFAGIAKYDYLGASLKQSDSAFIGLSVIRFGVDDIPNTLELIDENGNIRYDRIKSFSVADYAFVFSYARKSKIKGLDYGANAKVIRRVAGDFASAWGFGLDASATYKYNHWQFAAMARDVTSTFNAWSFQTEELKDVFTITGNEIPENSIEITLPRFILGAAYQFDINDKFSGLAEIDFDATTDGKRNVLIKSNPISIDPHLGFEFSFKKIVYLRGGISNIQKASDFDGKTSTTFQPNLGIGIRYKQFGLDYALTDIGDRSIALYSNVFTLFYAINKK